MWKCIAQFFLTSRFIMQVINRDNFKLVAVACQNLTWIHFYWHFDNFFIKNLILGLLIRVCYNLYIVTSATVRNYPKRLIYLCVIFFLKINPTWQVINHLSLLLSDLHLIPSFLSCSLAWFLLDYLKKMNDYSADDNVWVPLVLPKLSSHDKFNLSISTHTS